jgi:hypothetical protein
MELGSVAADAVRSSGADEIDTSLAAQRLQEIRNRGGVEALIPSQLLNSNFFVISDFTLQSHAAIEFFVCAFRAAAADSLKTCGGRIRILVCPEIGTWADHPDDGIELAPLQIVAIELNQRILELRVANAGANDADLLFAALRRFSTALVADGDEFDRVIEQTRHQRHLIHRLAFFCSRVLCAPAATLAGDMCAAGCQSMSACCASNCQCYWIENLDQKYIHPAVVECNQGTIGVNLSPISHLHGNEYRGIDLLRTTLNIPTSILILIHILILIPILSYSCSR